MNEPLLKNILNELNKIIEKTKGNVVSKTFINNLNKIENNEILKECFEIEVEEKQQEHYYGEILNYNNFKDYLNNINVQTFKNEDNVIFIQNYLIELLNKGMIDNQLSKLFIEEFSIYEDKIELLKYFNINIINKVEKVNLIHIKENKINFLKKCIKSGTIIIEKIKVKSTEIEKSTSSLKIISKKNESKELFIEEENWKPQLNKTLRSELALHNKTHDGTASASIIILIQENIIYSVVHPLPYGLKINTPKTFEKALIIENLDNFLHYQEFIKNLSSNIKLNEFDIIYSSGSAINSEKIEIF